jgi:hypothetical protein
LRQACNRPLQILLLRLGYSAHLAHCCSNFRAAAAELVVAIKAAAAVLWLAAVAVAAKIDAAVAATAPAGAGLPQVRVELPRF